MASSTSGYNVKIEPFDVDNYATWSYQMKMLLIERGLWEGVESESPDSRVCAKALASIALNVKPHHISLLKDKTTAKDAWKALKQLYETQGMAARMQLLSKLQMLQLGDQESMVLYFARVRELRDRLHAVGDAVGDVQLVLHLLNGLPSEYDLEKVLISSQQETPTLERTFDVLLRAEQRIKADAEPEAGSKLLYMKSRRFRDLECYYCGKKGHIKADCVKRKKDEKHYGAALVAL